MPSSYPTSQDWKTNWGGSGTRYENIFFVMTNECEINLVDPRLFREY